MPRDVRIPNSTVRRLTICLLSLLLSLGLRAQIVNQLHVDQPTFLRYAQARMQEYSPDNLPLADSLYQEGVHKNNIRYKCLGLSLEMPVRYAQGEYERMDEVAAEMKELLSDRKDLREFYFSFLDEYCGFLLLLDRVSDAVLETREMERQAVAERNAQGRMYAYRLLGLIQSYRSNSFHAVENFEQALRFCREARTEQEMPNLYILIAEEEVKMQHFEEAEAACEQAESYQDFFPSLRPKVLITRALLCHAQGDFPAFWDYYERLTKDPTYSLQADADTRNGLDITFLRSKGLLKEALEKADALGSRRARLEQKHAIYALQGAYRQAYDQLSQLMEEKDSTYIKVQNEDVAILEAELHNVQLREEAHRLKVRNQFTILTSFLLMFVIAFFTVLLHQWRLRENLDRMKAQNSAQLMERRAFQQALNAKEVENNMRIKFLQKKQYNTFE